MSPEETTTGAFFLKFYESNEDDSEPEHSEDVGVYWLALFTSINAKSATVGILD